MEKINKILVTGGAGFIGSNLVKALVEKGYKVKVLDNLLRGNKLDTEILRKIEFIQGDVRDYDTVLNASKNCEVIYHFAAILGVDIVADNPVETMEVETIGLQNTCKAALINGVDKILYASTSGIYGHSAIEKSVDEEMLVDPKTSYAMAKRYNEIYLSALYNEKGINSIALRFFNVYGYKQDNRMVIPRFFEQAINDKPLTVFGNGQQTRDFTFIEDTVEACIKLMEKVSGFEIFNISNENEWSILDLAKEVKQVTKSSSEISFIEAPKNRYDYEVERRVGTAKKLYKFTGMKPVTSLKIGLKNIYYQSYLKTKRN